MNKSFGVAFAIGLLAAAVIIGGVFYLKQGPRTAPHGAISKVRTQAIDETNALAVLDLHMVNDSDANLLVRDIAVKLVTPDGKEISGALLAGSDAKTMFHYYPQLGTQSNEPLREQDRVQPHQTVDRMLAARFEASEKTMQARKKITVRLTDVDGTITEFSSELH